MKHLVLICGVLLVAIGVGVINGVGYGILAAGGLAVVAATLWYLSDASR